MSDAKIVVVPTRSIADSITLLLQDREELQWMVAIGRAKNGDLIFYDNSEEGIGSQILSRLSRNKAEACEESRNDQQTLESGPQRDRNAGVIRLDSGDVYGRRATYAGFRRPTSPTFRRIR